MALFSLLLVLFIERARLLGDRLQFEPVFARYREVLFDEQKLKQWPYMLVALLLPALGVHWVIQGVIGTWFGVWHLAVWIGIGLLLFGHNPLRERFRQYLVAACRGDTQACYHYVEQLDCGQSTEDRSELSIGVHMGQIAAWLNYRYYAAVTLYFVALGPAVALFYCTVRAYHDHFAQQQLKRPLIGPLLHLLDWLPCRIVALGFALSGHFSRAMTVLIPLILDPFVPARSVITQVALAAEELPANAEQEPVCVQSTMALLQLAKRNLILLLIVVSILTILGVLA
ncbi:beta-lactamase regulator AmpE [Ferrimonas pelagia]|uniref:Beta-lactamase regulator AmpE n=1 Tax=Ferrimonas pelagia TaxID=1177826 RepID=A0ABP9FNG5_9GAMM